MYLFYKHGRKYPAELKKQAQISIEKMEKLMGKKFGNPENPLLVSVRSGARKSMPE